MEEYTLKQDYENSANECGRNILETITGRKYLDKIAVKYESFLEEVMDEELFKK